jgi:hypothetical protein
MKLMPPFLWAGLHCGDRVEKWELADQTDSEILEWPIDPPSFTESISSIRNQIAQKVGHVDIPINWDDAHSEVRRPLKTDAGRLERKRPVSVSFPWEAPRFDSGHHCEAARPRRSAGDLI